MTTIEGYITPAMLAAARHLIKVDQEDVARDTGVAVSSIRRFEAQQPRHGKLKCTPTLYSHLLRYFAKRDVTFKRQGGDVWVCLERGAA